MTNISAKITMKEGGYLQGQIDLKSAENFSQNDLKILVDLCAYSQHFIFFVTYVGV